MKIYTVTDNFFGSISHLFRNLGTVEVLPKNYARLSGFSADLIVFAGGEDINPRHYGVNIEGHWNDERDNWELKVAKDIMSGKLKTKKTLGICRGLQLLNVATGGTLFMDIADNFGKGHEPIHPLSHTMKNSFQFLKVTNSMHHQAIAARNRQGTWASTILAIEPATRLTEIILWSTKMLGVQFHPEFFDDENVAKGEFVKVMSNWIDGKDSIIESENLEKKKFISTPFRYTTGSAGEAPSISANLADDNVEVQIDPSFTSSFSMNAGDTVIAETPSHWQEMRTAQEMRAIRGDYGGINFTRSTPETTEGE